MIANKGMFQSLLTEKDVACITGLSLAKVRRWRLLRQGPKFIKIGAAVRYKPQEETVLRANRLVSSEPSW